MAKPFVCQVGVAQIPANPAYSDEVTNAVQEPGFPGKDEKLGLHKIAGIDEVGILRNKIESRYLAHLGRRLEAIITFASASGTELLVFPEYSIPAQALPACKVLSDALKITIIAGSHVVTSNSAARRAYRELDLLDEVNAREQDLPANVQSAICVVLRPGVRPSCFPKYALSKWESSLVGGFPAYHSFEMQGKAGKFEVQVLICIEALSDLKPPRERHNIPRLLVIPAFSPSCSNFYDLGRLTLLQGKCTVFSNVADYGGSRVFARAENANYWFTTQDGTLEVPKHSEALLNVTIDLEKQFEVRKSSGVHTAVLDVRVHPTLYPTATGSSRLYLDFLNQFKSSLMSLDAIAAGAKPFLNLNGKVFPRLLQEKLQHFVSHIATAGTIPREQASKWVCPIVIPDLQTTDQLRWDLCNEAVQEVNELQLSPKYVHKSKDLIDVQAHLLGKRNELLSIIDPADRPQVQPKQQSLIDQIQQRGDSPFINRHDAFDQLSRFVNSRDKTTFVLSGMRGIGKSSLIQEAFRQVIPPRKSIRLQLTEGISYQRLLAELAYRCNLRIPDDLNFSSLQKQEELEQKVLAALNLGQGAIVVLDDFQFLLVAGEIEDQAIRRFVGNLVGSDTTRSKYFIISNTAPRFGAEYDRFLFKYTLHGLKANDTERLLLYWFQYESNTIGGQVLAPSEKALSILAGHPLATRVAGRLWADHPTQDIAKDLTIFNELRDTIVSFLLEKIHLQSQESELLSFASILRLPAPRELFLKWQGEKGLSLLETLANQYLVETSEGGYHLHPLVRDYFYQKLSLPDAVPFHKIAGKFYMEQFEQIKAAKKEIVPEFLGEAVHHYLSAGERARVQTLAFYKQELKPVALSHYRKADYKAALKDYRVLVELDSRDADAHFHLSLIYARENKWDDAELHFGKARELKPRAVWILQGFGGAKLRAHKIAEARELFEEALSLNPDHSPTLADLGRLHEQTGDRPGAEAYYRRAIEVDSENSFAYYMLARLLYKDGAIPEALEMAMAAQATRPLDLRNKRLVDELRSKLGSDADT